MKTVTAENLITVPRGFIAAARYTSSAFRVLPGTTGKHCFAGRFEQEATHGGELQPVHLVDGAEGGEPPSDPQVIQVLLGIQGGHAA
jgi:hypothetical protein